jgi:DNA-binding NarL/FixJ family response regulator
MDISREQEIQFRRDRVLELSSKGLTQQEIAVQLKYTQQTISNDLKYLQKKELNYRVRWKKVTRNSAYGHILPT